ncbi:MAG: hypothetical protein ACK2T3_13150, partial [Candidatus Promineifilaceae bacterium]
MTAFVNHFSFEFRTGIRNKQLLLMNYLFPLGFFLMMGFIMIGINPLFLDTMTQAMVVFASLVASGRLSWSRYLDRTDIQATTATLAGAETPPQAGLAAAPATAT